MTIGSDEAIQSAVVPFTLDRHPVVIDVRSAMRGEVVRTDGASLAIRLSKVGGDANLSDLGVMAKVVVEGVILLAGDDDMLDGSISGDRRNRPYRLVPAACREGQAGSRECSQCSQHATP